MVHCPFYRTEKPKIQEIVHTRLPSDVGNFRISAEKAFDQWGKMAYGIQ
jgi:hypothetical protein